MLTATSDIEDVIGTPVAAAVSIPVGGNVNNLTASRFNLTPNAAAVEFPIRYDNDDQQGNAAQDHQDRVGIL
ncbi:MAG: hypothetical protein LAO20_10290 [Acidobacteriia bacterium]|nr:hypothetical protein [Terriglobia bacterium]